FEGGQGPLYSSAIVMRADAPGVQTVAANGTADLPVTSMRGRRLAFNSSDSLSGVLALERDLQHIGQSLDIFSDRILTGGHRNSIKAVANGEADVAAIDCRSWALARRFEPAAEALIVVGWTALRPGLPFIVSRHLPGKTIQSIRRIVARNAGT
ncbi:MAG: phosphate/phosphite/phosphonate ABC transporter substrate-binding protein, partial [Sphingobium sp.]